MTPSERRIRLDDVELCVFEWGCPSPTASTIVLAHATGFHARCWDPVVAHLGDRHVVALDQRGHGRSDTSEITHWDAFGRDLASVVDALDLSRIVGVGHSMGGHAMTDAAALRPARFESLLLIDPVIASPEDYGTGEWTVSQGEDPHPTARRKGRFRSAQEMAERFRNRPPYSGFHPDALRAYCEHGLLPAPDGNGWMLACPPATEASVYATSRTNSGVHDSAGALEIPVLIVRAKLPPPDREAMDFSSSPTWPGLVGAYPRGREIHLADRTHFIPLETPDYVARLILESP